MIFCVCLCVRVQIALRLDRSRIARFVFFFVVVIIISECVRNTYLRFIVFDWALCERVSAANLAVHESSEECKLL